MVAVIKRMLADGGVLHQLASCAGEKHLYFRRRCEILLSVWWAFSSRETITWISLAKWWLGDRRPIDGGRARRAQAKLCLLIARGAGRAQAWAGKPGRDQIKWSAGVRASLLWYKWLWRPALSSHLKENVTSAVKELPKDQNRPDADVTRPRRGQPSLLLLAMSLHRTAKHWFQRISDVQ